MSFEDDSDIWSHIPMLDIHQFQAVQLLVETKKQLIKLTDWQKKSYPAEAKIIKKIDKYLKSLECD